MINLIYKFKNRNDIYMANEKERKEITLNIELPHDFRIVRYGDSDTLELESLEYDFDRKERKKLKTKSWKFVGYYSTVEAAAKGYIRLAPSKRMIGNKTLTEVRRFVLDIKKVADNILA